MLSILQARAALRFADISSNKISERSTKIGTSFRGTRNISANADAETMAVEGKQDTASLHFRLSRNFLRYQFSVFRWGHAFKLAEKAAEVEGILVADNGGDLCHGVIGGFQQAGGIVHPDGQQVLHGGMVHDLLKIPLEVADAHIPGLSVVLDGDGLVVMLVEVTAGVLHFLLDVGGHRRLLLLPGALDQQEDLPQVHGKQFRKPSPAGLQFADHLFEEVGVCRGGAGVEYGIVHGDLILAQNVPEPCPWRRSCRDFWRMQ